MGNCHFKTEFETENVTGKLVIKLQSPLLFTNILSFPQPRFINNLSVALTKGNFTYQYCIGKGGFGKVWKVERKKTKQQYAMKEMSKARIITKRSVKSVINERQILTQLHNPFIVNMYYAF